MRPSSLLILADRGALIAYAVAETPTRGPTLRLVDDFQITGLERELPVNVEEAQHNVMLTKDWPALQAETDRRTWKQLADRRQRQFQL